MKIEKIGKRNLKMNDDHMLPEYYKNFLLYDRALPRIAKQVKEIDGELFFVDVGANIGDTVVLVSDETSGNFLCVEGEEEYLNFLKENTKGARDSNFEIEDSFCGEKEKNKGILIKEAGTARIEEKENKDGEVLKLKTLDEIIEKHKLFYKTNLLKIDTDGFEVSVLKSGNNFLSESQPLIYFEFDPDFYQKNNFQPLEVFEFLFSKGYKKGLFYDNFGLPIKIVNFAKQEDIKFLIDQIDKNNIYYFDVLTLPESKEKRYKKIFEKELLDCLNVLNVNLKKEKGKLIELENNLRSSQNELTNANNQLSQTQTELSQTQTKLSQTQTELEKIYRSREWRVALFLQKMFKWFFPAGSLRRKGLFFSFKLAKLVQKIFCNKLPTKNLKTKRKINLKSKKIVFVDHSYHHKTKSSSFMLDYLKEFFEVEVVLDESWQGRPAPDLSFIDEDYLAVIFWQILPSPETVAQIKNENILYFPMYDQSGRLELDFWSKYSSLKIVNFSRALHQKLKSWGFQSLYVQYFPEVKDFYPGKAEEAFFWQRLSFINFEVVKKLFGKEKIKIHLHQAVDPNQQFLKPSQEDIEKFQITFSDWFDTREEMLELIREKAIYVAPREYEGIGMSFLEAMAMGKLVVANNQPTMNEYIENGKTGLLFDWQNPQPLDFSQREKIQKNAYEFMKKGREKWEKEKEKIVEFIKEV